MLSVSIIEPATWLKPTRYRLLMPLKLVGHTVPAGFKTDGATVPRFLSLLGVVCVLLGYWLACYLVLWLGLLFLLGVVWFPPVGRYARAAVLHDYLLALQPDNRHFADREFLRAMKVLKIAAWRRWTMFICVWCWSEVIMRWR